MSGVQHGALPVLSEIYDSIHSALPILGSWWRETGILINTLRRASAVPEPNGFCLNDHGRRLEQVRHQNVSGGIAAIHSAWRL